MSKKQTSSLPEQATKGEAMNEHNAAKHREEVHRAAVQRRVVGLSHVWGSVLLMAALFAMVNYLGYRHYERWDWTTNKVFSLSERTIAELEALSQPVDIYLFVSQAEPNFPELRELLERYRATSSKVTAHFVDPDRQPAEFRMYAERFGIQGELMETGETLADVAVVVTAAEKKWTITRDDLVSIDFDSLDSDDGPQIDVKAEQALTGAILEVVRGRPSKLCVVTGHGEWRLEGGGDRGLDALAQELKRDNFTFETIKSRADADIDSSCDVVMVVQPLRAFDASEAARLRTYVNGGGNLFLALDPEIEGERVVPTGLESLLADWGVGLRQAIVFESDPAQLLPPGNPLGPFVVTQYGDHPSMRALKAMEGPTLFMLAQGFEVTESAGAQALLRTSSKSWGETSLSELSGEAGPAKSEGDLGGPLAVAVAVTARQSPGDDGAANAKGGRVMVFGDSDWLQAGPLADPRFTNRDLLLSSVGWLSQRQTLISIPPKKIDAQPMTITEDDLGGLLVRLMVMMPAAMLLLGASMWWSRRN